MILMTYVLPTAYQQVIHKTRYARWMEAENRRENWDETVSRYTTYMFEALEKHNGYFFWIPSWEGWGWVVLA